MKKQNLLAAFLSFVALAAAGGAIAQVTSIAVDELVTGQAELPVSGVVSTGQPNADALKIAADAGYAAVIDLRGTDEDRGLDEQSAVEALGMKYISLPIADKAAVNYSNAEELDRLLADFDSPVLVHCGSGNRVGALVALRERLHGATEADALEAGRAAGLTSLEPLVRERLVEDPQ
ncbi:MAG: sulfur transferase domain-containing protein [Gammaproteobacteria bacterium]|nr:sulfur transferase domain-containing protein [Gammaproteobacteria bacterium]MDH4314552.1 sulfur transferase domain-containing protein [Gammaproteobacteria bacterium]MDH5213763.1 sulfur transferase domain-containing protein [Gammaproteobacteria bacterium]